MSRKFFSLIVLSFILSSCLLGGFDISGGLFKHKPYTPETTDRVHWEYYNDEVVRVLPFEHDCILFYTKHELSCGECDAMDKTFKNQKVVSILNNNFITVKATDDMPDWEKAVSRMDIKITPTISIMAGGTLFHHEGSAIPTRAFIRILNEASGKCYDYSNGKSSR